MVEEIDVVAFLARHIQSSSIFQCGKDGSFRTCRSTGGYAYETWYKTSEYVADIRNDRVDSVILVGCCSLHVLLVLFVDMPSLQS